MNTTEDFKNLRGIPATRITPGGKADTVRKLSARQAAAARGRRGSRRIAPDTEKQIIQLYFDEGLTRIAVAEVTGVGEHAIQLAVAREQGRREERARWLRAGAWDERDAS